MDESIDTPSVDIDPYKTLEVAEDVNATTIKSAYKRLALLHHPDKVALDEKEKSKSKFQEIVSAYAILSDERRRKRYDTTGSTAESLDIDDDDFNWLDFFRAQWSETITSATILDHKQKYQGSEQEKQDVMTAYEKSKGNMTQVFEQVELSNVLDDEQRFRQWIDEDIAAGRAERHSQYVNETEKSKATRRKRAHKEAQDAEVHLAETQKKSKKGHKEGDLLAMIRGRQQSRGTAMLDALEAKYAPQAGLENGSKKRKRKVDEPPEEAFRKNAEKSSVAKRGKGSGEQRNVAAIEAENEAVGPEGISPEAERGEGRTGKNRKPSKATRSGRRGAQGHGHK